MKLTRISVNSSLGGGHLDDGDAEGGAGEVVHAQALEVADGAGVGGLLAANADLVVCQLKLLIIKP